MLRAVALFGAWCLPLLPEALAGELSFEEPRSGPLVMLCFALGRESLFGDATCCHPPFACALLSTMAVPTCRGPKPHTRTLRASLRQQTPDAPLAPSLRAGYRRPVARRCGKMPAARAHRAASRVRPASNPRRDATSPCGRPPGDGEFYPAAAPLALVRSPITATGNVRTGTASLALPYSGRAVSRHSHVFPLMKMDFSGCLENPGKTDRVPTDLLVPVTIQLYQDFLLQPFRPIHASQRYVQVNRGLFIPFHSSRGLSSLISTLPCSCIGLAIYALDVTFCLTARTRSKR